MSLTKFIQEEDVKERFLKEFRLPLSNGSIPLLAPSVTTNWALVGTAYDYLLRFILQKEGGRIVKNFEWVACHAARLLKGTPHIKVVRQIIEDATKSWEDFRIGKKPADILIPHCLKLATLDSIYRSRTGYSNIGVVDEGDVVDMENLLCITKPEIFRGKKRVLLNPSFGRASMLVGGADADLIIDNVLIDIKTTKRAELNRDIFNQLMGYYILEYMNNDYESTIDRIGVYFSRYGDLVSFPVSDVVNLKTFPKFVRWFEERAGKYRHRNGG